MGLWSAAAQRAERIVPTMESTLAKNPETARLTRARGLPAPPTLTGVAGGHAVNGMVVLRSSPAGFPMAPSVEEWEALSPAERDAVTAALPGEVTDAEMSPPEAIFTSGPRPVRSGRCAATSHSSGIGPIAQGFREGAGRMRGARRARCGYRGGAGTLASSGSHQPGGGAGVALASSLRAPQSARWRRRLRQISKRG